MRVAAPIRSVEILQIGSQMATPASRTSIPLLPPVSAAFVSSSLNGGLEGLAKFFLEHHVGQDPNAHVVAFGCGIGR